VIALEPVAELWLHFQQVVAYLKQKTMPLAMMNPRRREENQLSKT
jgi:hypothetical protein